MKSPLELFFLGITLIALFWIGAVISGCSSLSLINSDSTYCNTVQDCPIVVCPKCPDPYNETWQNDIINECLTDCEISMNKDNQ